MTRSDIIDRSTVLLNGAPWNTQIYHFNESQALDLWNMAATDLVEVFKVLSDDGKAASSTNGQCHITPATPETLASSKPLKRCSDGVEFDAVLNATSTYLVIPSGAYMFRFGGAGFAAKTTRLTAVQTMRKSCDCDCAPAPATAPAPPVTATFSPCPATFPMKWDFDQQVYPSLAALKTAISAFMGVTVGYTAPCTFTAPAGSVFPSLALSAPPAPPLPNTQVLSPCPVFPAQWAGQVYANATAFAAGVAAYGTGWSYNISTCTITAPQGATFPTAPSAAPVSPITGVACPLVFPLIYQNINCANALALDQAIEQTLGVSVTVSSAAPCQVVQTSGAVGAMPASIVVSAVPAPATATLSPCPIVWPMVWSIDSQTYTSIVGFKAALDSFLGLVTVFSPPCTFTAPSGTVFPSLTMTAVPAAKTAALSISKSTSSATAIIGQPHSFTLNVSNTGPDAANGAVVQDMLPSAFAVSSIAITYGGGANGAASTTSSQIQSGFVITTLPVGGTVVFVVSGSYSAATSQTNVAQITAPAGVTNSTPQNSTTPSTGAGAPTVSVINPPPAAHDLSVVSKTVSNAAPNVGDIITYTITYANNGADPALAPKVFDVLPSQLQAQSITFTNTGGANAPLSAAVGDFIGAGVTVPNMPNGSTVIATLKCQVVTAGTFSNQAGITIPPTATDPVIGNNTLIGASVTATAVAAPQADLSITKTASVSTITVGDAFSWTINISNAGSAAANGAVVTDAIPAAFAVSGITVAYSGGAGGAFSTSAGVLGSGFAITTLPSGGMATIIINGAFTAVTTQTNTASVATPAGVIDPNQANNNTPITGIGAPTVVVLPPVTCYLTLGAVQGNSIGTRAFTFVDCPPSQRAAYDAAGFSVHNSSTGQFITMVKDVSGSECGINFTEPFNDSIGTLIGYLPY
jgi:uncharacterized repeat protein (TIGR01451 family)